MAVRSPNRSLNLSIDTKGTGHGFDETELLSTSDKRSMRTTALLKAKGSLAPGSSEIKAVINRMEQIVTEDDEELEFSRTNSKESPLKPGEEVLCRHAHTKRELLKKLSYLAQPGDPAALEACLGFLKDGDRTVRTEAVIALNELIPRDSLLSFDCRADIIHALGRACMDWSTQVRQRATDLLKIVGNKTMGDAPAAVLKYLKIEAQRLPTYARLAAVDAVCQVSVAGDEDTVESLLELLDEDESMDVKFSVVNALRALTRKGKSQNVVNALLPLVLSVSDQAVKIAAINAVTDVASKGDSRVIRTLCDVAVSQDVGRLTAVKCLVETADEGDEMAIEACLRVSEDLDATLRLEAVQALGQLAEVEDEETVISFLRKLDRDRTAEAFPPNFLGEGLGDGDAGDTMLSFKGSMRKKFGEKSFKGGKQNASNKRMIGLPPTAEEGLEAARHRHHVGNGLGLHSPKHATFDSGASSPTGKGSVSVSSESRWENGSNADAWRRQHADQRHQDMFDRPSEAGLSIDKRRGRVWTEDANVMSEPSARGYRVWVGGGCKDKFDPRRNNQKNRNELRAALEASHKQHKTDPDARVRCAALKGLSRIGPEGHLDVIGIVEDRLKDADSHVRKAAMQALNRLILPDKMMESATEEEMKVASELISTYRSYLLSHIEDRSGKTKALALAGLSIVLMPGDVMAVNKISENLKSLDRQSVIKLLRQLMPPGSQVVIDCILDCMEEPQPSLNEQGLALREQNLKFMVENLVGAAGKGNRSAIDRLILMTRSPTIDRSGRMSSFVALHRLTTFKDKAYILEQLQMQKKKEEEEKAKEEEEARAAVTTETGLGFVHATAVHAHTMAGTVPVDHHPLH